MIALSSFAQDAEELQGKSYIASLDLFSVSGGSPDIRFEVSLNERSSMMLARVFVSVSFLRRC